MTELRPPGPRRVLFMRRHPEAFLKLARKYGDIVRFEVGRREIWLVSRPDLIAGIFRDSYTHFEKDWGPRRGTSVFGNGLLTSEGDAHRGQRMDFSRVFARPAVEAKLPLVAAAIEAWSARQRDGATIDLFREMSFLGSDVAARALFGCSIDPAAIGDAMDRVGRRFRRVMFPYADRLRIKRDSGAALYEIVRQVKLHGTADGLLGPGALPTIRSRRFW